MPVTFCLQHNLIRNVLKIRLFWYFNFYGNTYLDLDSVLCFILHVDIFLIQKHIGGDGGRGVAAPSVRVVSSEHSTFGNTNSVMKGILSRRLRHHLAPTSDCTCLYDMFKETYPLVSAHMIIMLVMSTFYLHDRLKDSELIGIIKFLKGKYTIFFEL